MPGRITTPASTTARPAAAPRPGGTRRRAGRGRERRAARAPASGLRDDGPDGRDRPRGLRQDHPARAGGAGRRPPRRVADPRSVAPCPAPRGRDRGGAVPRGAGPGEPFLLVLDNADALASRSARAALEALVNDLPPGARVALGCRADPGLLLGRRLVEGGLVQITAADLAFDAQEAGGPPGGGGRRAGPRGPRRDRGADRGLAGGHPPRRPAPRRTRGPLGGRARVRGRRPDGRRLPAARSCSPTCRRRRSPS